MVSIEDKVREVQQARTEGDAARDLREQLWGDCQGVVGSLATRFTRRNPQWRDDLAGEAYLKFEQALVSFDPDRGVPFRGFLAGCIQRAFIDRLRRRREELVTFSDELADPVEADLVCLEELVRLVHDTIDALLPRDRQRERKLAAFRLRHIDGLCVEEIRARLGVNCANTVSQWIHKVRSAFAHEFLRRHPEYFTDKAEPDL